MQPSLITTKTLNCKECGRGLIRIGGDGIIKAKGVVTEKILGYAPKAGDCFRLTCKCCRRIIGPHDLVLEDY